MRSSSNKGLYEVESLFIMIFRVGVHWTDSNVNGDLVGNSTFFLMYSIKPD